MTRFQRRLDMHDPLVSNLEKKVLDRLMWLGEEHQNWEATGSGLPSVSGSGGHIFSGTPTQISWDPWDPTIGVKWLDLVRQDKRGQRESRLFDPGGFVYRVFFRNESNLEEIIKIIGDEPDERAFKTPRKEERNSAREELRDKITNQDDLLRPLYVGECGMSVYERFKDEHFSGLLNFRRRIEDQQEDTSRERGVLALLREFVRAILESRMYEPDKEKKSGNETITDNNRKNVAEKFVLQQIRIFERRSKQKTP